MKRKRCCYCKRLFIPNPRVGERQKTCGDPICQKAHKAKNNARWRDKNPDYFHNDYPRIKQWLDQHPGYLKQYRESHPEYMKKNREAQRVRDRRKKLRLDIQAEIKSQGPEITNQLWDLHKILYTTVNMIQTIRDRLFLIPGKLACSSRHYVLKLERSWAYRKQYEEALARLT